MIPRRRHLRLLERALLAIGLACLGYYGLATLHAAHVRQQQLAALDAAFHARASAAPATAATAAPVEEPGVPAASSAVATPARSSAPASTAAGVLPAASVRGAALAVLEIPRLHLRAPVLPGDDQETLDVGVGHLPDTPLPWEPGNSAFAAHRDGLFRPLRKIRVGDTVRVQSARGTATYQVRETKVVHPDDLSVLAPRTVDTLTLITCYPFDYIGAAPKRFIVHAERVADADQR